MPPAVSNADIVSGNGTSFRSTTSYQCQAGFWLRRNSYTWTSQCQHDGTWSNIDVRCKGNESIRHYYSRILILNLKNTQLEEEFTKQGNWQKETENKAFIF